MTKTIDPELARLTALLTSLKAKRPGRPNKATKETERAYSEAEREQYLCELADACAPFYSLDLIRGWANDAAERKDYPGPAWGHKKTRETHHTVHPAGGCDDDCPLCLRSEQVAGIYHRHTGDGEAIQSEVDRLNTVEQKIELLGKIGKRLQKQEILEAVEKWWNKDHLRLREIAEQLGLEPKDAWQYVTALRRQGKAPKRR